MNKKTILTSILALAVLASAGLASAGEPALYQISPIAEAPASINTPATNIWDAYPWFSKDGKLFFFTREIQGTGLAHAYVSYISNRGPVINKGIGETLPPLTVANPVKLDGAWNNGTVASQTIKAIAYCESAPPETVNGTDRKYRFVLFYSSGAERNRKMYRVGLEVVVDINELKIRSSEVTEPENMMGSNVNVAGFEKNSTEPMLTRDGRYFFWASNSFEDKRTHYIEVPATAACTQDNDPIWKYEFLPSDRFAWQDQFVDSPAADIFETSRTNYHTVLERATRVTALIFERCNAVVDAPCSEEGESRYCDCAIDADPNVPKSKKYGVLMTTGFDSGNDPHEIKQCFTTLPGGTWNLNNGPQAETNLRDTHPAISGPPTLGGHWLLFFMRQKKIWYTKIAECPDASCECPVD